MRRFAAPLLVVLPGCLLALDVPEGAQIKCARTDDCPEGFLCNPNTSLCISADAPDTEPPRILSAVSVAPALAGAGQTVTVSFEVSEPVVAAELYFEDRGVRLDGNRTSGPTATTLTFSYVAQGSEEETLHPLYVLLEDAAKNKQGGAVQAAVAFDFTDPEVVGEIALTLTPAAGNPLYTARSFPVDLAALPRAATTGARLEAAFVISEPLDPSTQIVIELENGTPAPTFLLAGQVGMGVVYEARVESTAEETAFDLLVTLEDEAGNTSTTTVPAALTVDLSPPDSPDVASDDVIVYTRTPWGTATTSGDPEFSVSGTEGAVESGALVFVTAGVVSANVLAVSLAGGDGSFPKILLPAIDRPTVTIIAVDAAGNASTPAVIDQVTWTASLGGKVPGSSLENVNAFYSSPRFAGSLLASGMLELGAADGLEAVDCADGCVAPLPAAWGAGAWAPDFPSVDGDSNGFVPNIGMAVAYDAGRDVIVAFGGEVPGFALSNDTWEWDGEVWSLAYVPGSKPEPRKGARMAYHAGLGKVVLFGGASDSGQPCSPQVSYYCGDTWTWNGRVWQELAITGPSARYQHEMAYHPGRKQVVLVGGWNSTTQPSDSWALTCSSGTCSWASIAGEVPPGHHNGAIAFDDNDGQLVLFGGCAASAWVCSEDWRLAEVWTLGATGGWAQWTADAGLRRELHAMAFDSARAEPLVWGVEQFAAGALTCGRPWSLDGSTFTCGSSAIAFGIRDQVERGSSYAIYRPQLEETLIIGPQEGSVLHRWNGGARDRPAQLFLAGFGVATGGSDRVLVSEVLFQPPAVPGYPGYGVQTPAAYDDALGRGWTCTKGTIEQMAAVDNNDPQAPDQRYDSYTQMLEKVQAMIVYDCSWEMALPDGEYLVRAVVGDSRHIGTRHSLFVEGVAAIDASTNATQPWLENTVAVSVVDGRLTLSSGPVNTRIAFVEIFRPTAVRDITVSWLAGAESDDYDPPLVLPLYYGSGATNPNVTIATDTAVSGSVLNNLAALLGHNPNRRWQLRVQLDDYSGSSPGTFDSWCVNLAGGSGTCETVSAPLTYRQGALGTIDLSGGTLAEIANGASVSFKLLGSSLGFKVELLLSPLSAGHEPGVALYGFDAGEWRELVSAPSATLNNPGWLTWSSTDAEEAARLLVGQSRLVGFAVAPIGMNGQLQPGASVASDYVEMTVRYRVSELPQ